MPAPMQQTVRLVIKLEAFPALADPILYRWSVEPLADADFTEGRIAEGGWSDLELSLSSLDGYYDGATVQFEVLDTDGAISSVLGSNQTSFVTNQDATIELLSQAGRASNLQWRPLLNGKLVNLEPSSPGRAKGTVRDMLGAEFGRLHLDRVLGRRVIGDEHFGCPIETRGRMYPHIVGEHSDEGSVAADGSDAALGAVPLIFVGYQLVYQNGSGLVPPGNESQILTMQPPTGLTATVVGTPGTAVYTYSVSAIVDGYGETAQSVKVSVLNGPDVLSASNYVRITWNDPPEYGQFVSRWRIHGRRTFLKPTRSLTIMVDSGTNQYDDTGVATEKLPIAPPVGTAQAQVLINGVLASPWGKMLVGLGAVRVHGLFGSDLGGEGDPDGGSRGTPSRVRIPLNHPDVLSPYLEDGSPNPAWPLPDPWLELTNPTTGETIRATYIGVKGPILQAHLDNEVTLAANVCGWTQNGDDTGLMVDNPGNALAMYLNEIVLKNGGEGYANGNFGPLETFANITSAGPPQVESIVEILRTSTFQAFDAQTMLWLPDNAGYKAQWYIDDGSLTLRNFLKQYCETFGCFIAPFDYGQIGLVWVNTALNLDAQVRHREHYHILDDELPRVKLHQNLMQAARRWQVHWLPDRQAYRNPDEIIRAAETKLAMRNPPQDPPVIQIRCSNDRPTCADAQARQLALRRWPIIEQAWHVGGHGHEIKLGQVVLLTHSKGGGRGPYNAHPFFITKKAASLNEARVRLTGLSLARLVGFGTADPGPADPLGSISIETSTTTESTSSVVSEATVQ